MHWVLLTLKVIQIECMTACWTGCSVKLNWFNFCAPVSGGRWYLSLDKKSIQIQLVEPDCDFTFHPGSILISCVFVAVCVNLLCVCETRQTRSKTFNALWVLGSHIWEHKGLRPSHIPSLHSWLKVIPPGWGELKYQFIRNAIEEASKFTHQGEDKSHPCPAMWGPLAERMNTIEGLFLAEQATGRPDDKWLLDSRERTVGPLKGREEIKSVHYGHFYFNNKC